MEIRKKPLPKHCVYNGDKPKIMSDVSGVVIHYFSASSRELHGQPNDRDKPIDFDYAFDMQNNYDLFVDLNNPGPERGLIMPKSNHKRYYASAHYLVGRDGVIWELIPPPIRAWHAGTSEWKGRKWCNNWMVGVEVIGMLNHPYEEAQYTAVKTITEEYMTAYKFGKEYVTGHENVAPGRKTDPGPTWDWEHFWES